MRDEERRAPAGARFLTIFICTLMVTLLAGGALFAVLIYSAARRQEYNRVLSEASARIPTEEIPQPEVQSPEAGEEAPEEMPEEVLAEEEPEEPEPEPEPEEVYPTASPNIVRTESGNYRVISTAEEDVVTFAFTGDILFDEGYAVAAAALQRGGIERSFDSEVLAAMRGEDVLIVNNEFPYSDRGTPTAGKAFTFRAHTDKVHWLPLIGADVAALANNHCFDYGEQAFLDTLDTLDSIDMIRVGAGREINEAASPVFFEIGDMKVALLNATQIERMDYPDTRGADEGLPGVFRCWQPDRLTEEIRKADQAADQVIVFMHWGTEKESMPDGWQTGRTQEMIDAGADVIVGAHPHCLQPISYKGSVPIIYSLGNFLFTSFTVDTGIAEIRFRPSTGELLSVRFVPMLQNNSTVTMLHDAEKQRVLDKLRSWDSSVSIDEDGYVVPR